MNIAFLGDSITLGYGLGDERYRYSTLVAQALNMKEKNCGITGTLVAKAGLNNEDENDFMSRAHLIDDADVAVVFGGTNDYFWSDKAIYGDLPCNFEYAVRALADRVKEKRKGKLTLFVTPYEHNGIGNFWFGDDWRHSNRHDTSEINFNGHRLRDYAELIEQICFEKDIPCLCLHKDFEFDHGRDTIDGCHPNEKGHAIIADSIIKKLMTILDIDLLGKV